MSNRGSCVLERPTLVLNRHWQPVRVATVARSLTMLWNETAYVVDPDDFQLYTWQERRDFHPHGVVSDARAGSLELDPPREAEAIGGDFQQAQRLQARPLDLPILRSPSWYARAHHRPRDPALKARFNHLGKLRACMCCLQRQEGESHTRTSGDETEKDSDAAILEACL